MKPHENRKHRSWIMKQTWSDLLFFHIPIDAAVLQTMIPGELKVDTYDGQAWIGIVPFEMKGIRLRGLPSMPYTSQIFELNVRTYVTYGGKPGVYFFSLDASKALQVWVARTFFFLPYYNADIRVTRENGKTRFISKRTHNGAAPGELDMTYWPTSEPFFSEPGDLAHWLTERYCLYTVKHNTVYRGNIIHEPWPLQHAACTISHDTLSGPFWNKQEKPLLHYSSGVDTYIMSYENVTKKS